jgi:2,4-dienoyl-CoA reductase-like NADH-dependent reductase (Old Yellow Enzyme family)
MTTLTDAVPFVHGAPLANRWMLAPLTNQQSHDDGTVSAEEIAWLQRRAEGGFALTMTCASHVDRLGQGFPGQMGCWSPAMDDGLAAVASAIRSAGSLPYIQLHHAGRRAPAALIGEQPVAPFDDPDTGARALSTDEVDAVIDAFVSAAVRAERAGFSGVELHGAHDYLLCEFLNPATDARTDRFGGTLERRLTVFSEILDGISARCGDDLTVMVRLSPERFGLVTAEIREVFSWLAHHPRVDAIDLSLWDTFKDAADEQFAGRPLLECFTELDRGTTVLAVAGHLRDGTSAQRALDLGADVVAIGRAAITNHDFPHRVASDPTAAMRDLPVARSVLLDESVSEAFIAYLTGWPNFVGEG